MQLVVCGMRRPVQLEGPEQNLGYTGRWGPSEAKVFRAHVPPQGACENLVRSVKLLANLQNGGGNLVDTIFNGSQERSRLKVTYESRRFTEVDNRKAVKTDELEKHSEAMKVVRLNLNRATFPDATIREGVDEWTVRAGMLRTLPPVDEDWLAICEAIYRGVEGAEYLKFVEMNKEK